ncbi:MAG: sialate O-acetylesterase [Armatimonadota bacterium]
MKGGQFSMPSASRSVRGGIDLCLRSARAVVAAALVVALPCGGANAALKVAGVFGSRMVLQRDAPVPVWGWANSGQQITVTFAGQSKTSTADENGKWRVDLDPMSANAIGQTMTVSGDGGSVSFTNVLVGEVWVLSGQSNMGWTLQDSDGGAEAAARAANYTWMRYFTMPFIFGGTNPEIEPYRDGPEPDVPAGSTWYVASSNAVRTWSAVGFFFAEALHSAIGVPIGLIRACQPSTYGESWISRAAQEADPNLAYVPDTFPQAGVLWYATPFVMYHVYVAPLQPFAIRGVLWYQGEANTQTNLAEHYRDLLDALVQSWRADWGQGAFPFLIVQLPRYDVAADPWHDWPLIREAQLQAWGDTSNTGLAITIDTHDASIHPTNKQPVGDRLARLARAMVHGEQIESTGPICSGYTAGFNSVTLHFDHVGTGLQAVGGDLRTFEVAGSDGVFHPAVAKITGTDSVRVTCSLVDRPLHVRYAWAWAPDCNLFNSEMLPASPFRADIDPAAYDSVPRLVGRWTFDSSGGSDPASNKASGASWSKLALAGAGACYSDGKLILPRYESGGSWHQSSATAMLQTDLGDGNYFKEMTQIAWVKWSGFDTTADSARLVSLAKFSCPSYQLSDLKAVQGIAMRATDDTNWASSRAWEYLDEGQVQTASAWLSLGGSDPPTDIFIKIAQVIRQEDENTFELSMYWDVGSRLTQIGASVPIPASQVSAFGQHDTDCLIDTSGGKRYDGFGIMDHCWSMPQSGGQIEFEEIWLCAGALDVQDIAEASFSPLEPPALVGQWTFDDYGGRGPLDNKAPGASWKNLTIVGTGAGVADGQLVLPRYENEGAWLQSRATTMLAGEMNTHFNEMTLVAWVKWSGYDPTADWARLVTLAKFPTSTYSAEDARAYRGIVMKATDDSNWHSYGRYEYLDGGALQTSPVWSPVGGLDPPIDRFIKIAQVLRWKDPLSYEVVMYWDVGSGLVQIGQPQSVPSHMVSSFGQAGSECLVEGAPPGNPRYDGLGLMDVCWNVPQFPGEIRFDEVRLYAGAMSAADIDALAPVSPPAKRLLGQWTFDEYLGSGPLENKAAGAAWAPLTLTGTGAAVIDGKLVLPRYFSGTWKQCSATTMLAEDLGPSGYFRELTHVLWLKWPGFDTLGEEARVAQLMKFSTNAFNNANWRAGQSIVFWAPGETNWSAHRSYEYLDSGGSLQKTVQWAYFGGPDPPADRYVKLAEVLRFKDCTGYELVLYWDIGDGNGLVQVGSPVTLSYEQVNAFGQSGTDCLVSPLGGKRYDGYGLMDFCWAVPASAGEIIFEETRLYGGALTQAEIAALRYVGEPEPPKPVVGTSLRSLGDSILDSAADKYDWVLWGAVTVIDADSFTIDDGSGAPVRVIATNHGLSNTKYVCVRGSLDRGTTPPTLTMKSIEVLR